MKRTLFFAILALTALGLGSCVKEGGVDRGDINGAIKLTAETVTATSVKIVGTCAQENVIGCYYVKPFEASQADLLGMDAIDRKAYILAHGTETTLPIKDSATLQLLAGTKYTVAVIGYDADKVFRTAPYFTSFTTGEATVNVTASQSSPSAFDFTYSIEKGEFASYVKYVASTDKSVTALDNDGLKALILKGGSAVKTTRADIPVAHETSKEKCDFVIAALAYDDLDRPGQMSSNLISTETIVKVNVAGNATTLSKPEKDVEFFEGTVDMPATGSFKINISGTDYGFTSYSGAGGIGTVNNMMSAIPFYNMTAEMTYKFTADKAFGQMTPVADGGNAFWLNMAAAAKVKVSVDLTLEGGAPRYRFEKVANDSKVVFYEGFDLSVWGGMYQAPVKGTSVSGDISLLDGSEPGTQSGASTTANGIDNFCWPASIPLDGTEKTLSDKLIQNWGLQDWTFKKAFLSVGHLRVTSTATNAYSYTLTPKFTKLTAPTTVTISLDAWNFAALVTNLSFKVVGAGKFTKAVVTNTEGYNQTFTAGTTATLTEDTFVPDAQMIVKPANNNVVNKVIAHIELTVEGATSETQFWMGTGTEPIASTKDARVCIDYIKVTK